jgi:hypothetical protein
MPARDVGWNDSVSISSIGRIPALTGVNTPPNAGVRRISGTSETVAGMALASTQLGEAG